MYRVEKVEVPGVTTRVVDWVLAVPLPGQDWARAAGQGRRAAGLCRGEGAKGGGNICGRFAGFPTTLLASVQSLAKSDSHTSENLSKRVCAAVGYGWSPSPARTEGPSASRRPPPSRWDRF